VAVGDNQLAALDGMRNKVARLRNEHMLKREEHYHDLQEIDAALSPLKERIRNLAFQRDECHKLAKSLSNAWLGMKITESVTEELGEYQRQLDAFDARIKNVEESQTRLIEQRGDKYAAYNLEAQDQEKLEAELKEIERRIAEIRGF
jgi:chromosome segregation ATPase